VTDQSADDLQPAVGDLVKTLTRLVKENKPSVSVLNIPTLASAAAAKAETEWVAATTTLIMRAFGSMDEAIMSSYAGAKNDLIAMLQHAAAALDSRLSTLAVVNHSVLGRDNASLASLSRSSGNTGDAEAYSLPIESEHSSIAWALVSESLRRYGSVLVLLLLCGFHGSIPCDE